MGTPEERILNVVKAGDFFGEMSLLVPDSKRSASVRGAGEETFLFELQRHRFEDMIQNQPAFAYKMIQAMSDRLRANNESIIMDLREKNEELAQAYDELKAAQADLIIKEKLETELETARTIQMNILPRDVVVPGGVDIGAFAFDISERKQAEEALQESEAKLQAILDNAPVYFFMKDEAGHYLLANQLTADLFNLPKEEVIGILLPQFFPSALSPVPIREIIRVLTYQALVE